MVAASIGRRFGRGLRLSLPVATSLAAVVVATFPVNLPGLAPVMPGFGLMAVYYWAVARPDLQPAAAVFLIGLVQDALTGSPPGLSSVIFVAAHAFTVSQRTLLFRRSFLLNWFGFAALALGAGFLSFLLASLYYWNLVPVVQMLVHVLLTILVYPVGALGFAQAHRSLRGD